MFILLKLKTYNETNIAEMMSLSFKHIHMYLPKFV